MSPSERRGFPRYPIGGEIRLFLGAHQIEMRARIEDMSQGGLRLSAPNLTIGSDVRMHVHVARPDGKSITATTKVVRCNDGGIAFQFESIKGNDRMLLADSEFWTETHPDRVYVAPIDTPRWWWNPSGGGKA